MTLPFFVVDRVGWGTGQGGGRGRGKAAHDDGDSDFEDGPKKKASKNKVKALPPPPPTRAIVPELVESASGGMVRIGLVFLGRCCCFWFWS